MSKPLLLNGKCKPLRSGVKKETIFTSDIKRKLAQSVLRKIVFNLLHHVKWVNHFETPRELKDYIDLVSPYLSLCNILSYRITRRISKLCNVPYIKVGGEAGRHVSPDCLKSCRANKAPYLTFLIVHQYYNRIPQWRDPFVCEQFEIYKIFANNFAWSERRARPSSGNTKEKARGFFPFAMQYFGKWNSLVRRNNKAISLVFCGLRDNGVEMVLILFWG